jgi:AP-2 complex subunit sigma-1
MAFAESRRKLTIPSRGKTRLAKWYAPYNDEEKIKLKGEVYLPFSCPSPSYPFPPPIHPPPLSSLHIFSTPIPSAHYRSPSQVHRLVAPRDQKYQSNFVEFRQNKIVYRRYAGLFFCACVDANDNELAYLEAIHFFVEVLDSFFGNVCELDLVFNFYKVRCLYPEREKGRRGARGLGGKERGEGGKKKEG